MPVVVTGAAGFIGYHAATALLKRGEEVVGIDNLNDYYPVRLKQARLAALSRSGGFRFIQADIACREVLLPLFDGLTAVSGIVHLAAQAGIRYSLQNPAAFVQANVVGQMVLLEAAQRLPDRVHFVYASSSSVYGGNSSLPFSVDDRVDNPLSVYAATKKAGELLTYACAHLHQFPATGLRLFTVYGPWGRPDMATWLFADAIAAGRPIRLFNSGEIRRDFTYIDDVVEGILAALDRPPGPDAAGVAHRVFNLGNNRVEDVRRLITVIEDGLGRKANIVLEPMQAGDVPATWADIESARRELGYDPRTTIETGIPRFLDWFKTWRGSMETNA